MYKCFNTYLYINHMNIELSQKCMSAAAICSHVTCSEGYHNGYVEFEYFNLGAPVLIVDISGMVKGISQV